MNSDNENIIAKKLSEMKIDYLKSTIFHEIISEVIGKYELGGHETFWRSLIHTFFYEIIYEIDNFIYDFIGGVGHETFSLSNFEPRNHT